MKKLDSTFLFQGGKNKQWLSEVSLWKSTLFRYERAWQKCAITLFHSETSHFCLHITLFHSEHTFVYTFSRWNFLAVKVRDCTLFSLWNFLVVTVGDFFSRKKNKQWLGRVSEREKENWIPAKGPTYLQRDLKYLQRDLRYLQRYLQIWN